MPSRRQFVGSSASALAWTAWPVHRPLRPRADIVLRNGTILDGTGVPGFEADLSVTAGRISAIGRGLPAGSEEIDCRDLVIAPGFVDIHSHGDGSLAQDPLAESLVRQGVTTIVVGQDGSGWRDDATLDRFDRLRPAVNVASMIGLGSLRGDVIGGADRPPTDAELQRMVARVESALAAGACGVSTGLEYTPGGYAATEELIALARPAARRRLPYASHLRNEDDRLLEALEEASSVATGAGCPLQVSHLKAQGPRNWGRMGDALSLLERLRNRGVDAGFDVYPYTAYQTGLTNLFPLWSREGGSARFLERVVGSDGARIRAETLAKVELIGGWNSVLISGVQADADRDVQGRRLGDLSGERAMDPYRLTLDLLTRNEGNVGMVGFAMSEENVERALAHPLSVVCSDGGAFATSGPARRGHPHPRGLGTFPRILGHYVRGRGVLSLSQAVHKMTASPAARVRLGDRGRLAVGLPADLVAFNPETVTDRATFTDPFQYPDGIPLVLVNGTVALRDGARGPRAGRALRPAPA